MRRLISIATILTLIFSAVAFAEEEPKPDQLKKMYDDALVQLKAAQDRKNELAIENEKLQKQIDDLKRQMAGYSEKTFYLRSHYEAWQQFISRYPHLMMRWRVFMENSLLDPANDVNTYIDPQWPLSVQ